MTKMGKQNRVKRAWNAFMNNAKPDNQIYDPWLLGNSTTYKPDRVELSYGNDTSIIASIYNRISVDVSSISLNHVELDKNGRYVKDKKTKLNRCLHTEANIDQTGRALIQDIVMSMFDEGTVAVVPTDTIGDPTFSSRYDVEELRVGKILAWYPNQVKVRLYNERTGEKEDIMCNKSSTAIIENPLYDTMNRENSTLKRLVAKLNLLDAIDNASGSSKLDLIIQLPFAIKNEAKRKIAAERLSSIEDQLTNSAHGIAYVDATEHITQLNRAVDNNMMEQITYLTSMLYSQLGLTESIFKGTADEKDMLNYYNRTVEPILNAITDEFKRKFLSKTAQTQNQSIMFIRDPFKLVPVAMLADIADKFTRNEILSSNEMRGIIGFKPVQTAEADELRNKNLNVPSDVDKTKEETSIKGDELDVEKDL